MLAGRLLCNFYAAKHDFAAIPKSWAIALQRSPSIALKVEWNEAKDGSPQTCYLGWAGGESPEGSILVPLQLAACLKLPEHTRVMVTVLQNVPFTRRMHVEPLSGPFSALALFFSCVLTL